MMESSRLRWTLSYQEGADIADDRQRDIRRDGLRKSAFLPAARLPHHLAVVERGEGSEGEAVRLAQLRDSAASVREHKANHDL